MSVRSLVGPGILDRYRIAFAIILIVAAALRLFGQDWDEGHYFHPDERFIATVMSDRLSVPSLSDIHLIFNPAESPLNTRSNGPEGEPRAFAYGSLPFIVGTVLGSALDGIFGTELTTYQNVGQFGRFLTTLVDLGTVVLVMLFARREFSPLAAVIAGALTATSVILIQLAHFYTVDTWVTFFTVGVLYSCLFVMRNFDLKWSLIAAGLGGAALATKVSVGFLGIPIILAMVIGARSLTANRIELARMVATRLLVSAVPAVLVFALFEPYAIWRPAPIIDDIRAQWEIVNGHNDIPFTRQFVGTIAGVNEIENLVLWGIAPGFGLAALIAVAVGLYWVVRGRDPRYLLLMSWMVPYFYIIATSEARFLRYSAPLVPPLAIIVGHQLAYMRQRTAEHRSTRLLASGAISVVVGVTLVWSLAFMSVYSRTHPRIEASEWIYENVEPGSTLTREVWDDTLPVDLGGPGSRNAYEHLSLELYADRPNDDAFDYIAGFLRDADYIVLSSQRLSHSIPRLPWRYPVQTAYYRLLEQEQLGYELAHESTNYPGFGDLRINTLRADESFSVYDHPPVRIYRKVADLSREELELRFAHALDRSRLAQREPPDGWLLLSEPVSETPAANDVGWSTSVTRQAPVAIVAWLFVLSVIGLAGLPLTVRLFSGFVDRGVGLAHLVGLLGLGILVWLLWSLELAPFSVWTAFVAFVCLAATGWLRIGQSGEVRARIVEKLPLIIAGQALFLVAFGLVLLLRAFNPDLWHPFYGGEKPMETAYLNAIARSESFPPYDPWFADGFINYYYYGFFLIAILWKLTGVPPDIAFQLSLATVAGLLAAGVFSLASTLTASALHTRRTPWLIAGGVLAVFMTMLAGNVDAIRQIVESSDLSVDFWQSSRVVDFAITEFPYFSFLYGDLHPHLIAAPVLVLILALAYSWIQSGASASPGWIALWGMATAVALGSITFINLWDGPTAAVIVLAALVVPLFRCVRDRTRQAVTALVLIAGSGLLAWTLFQPFHTRLYAPTSGIELTSSGTSTSDWLTHYGIFVLVILAAAAALLAKPLAGKGIQRPYLYFGGGLAEGCFLLALIVQGEGSPGGASIWLIGIAVALTGASLAQATAWIPYRWGRELEVVPLMPFIAAGGALAAYRPVAAISAFMVALFILLLLASPQRAAGIFLGICGAAASGLVLTADLIYVADHLRNSDWERMNTVFKVYFQAWTLFAITATLGLLWLVQRYRGLASGIKPGSLAAFNAGVVIVPVIGGVALLALGLLAYPAFATPDRLELRMDSSPSGLSLSGYEWMSGGEIRNQAGDVISFTGDFYAIEWLRDNVDENAVVLEASIGPYRGGGSRISSATGLPAVLGWESHQSQQRDSAPVRPRADGIRELYQTSDLDRKGYLLRQYNVDYVIVGDVERYSIVGEVREGGDPEYYSSPEGLDAFAEMLGEDLEVVFQSHGTTIYRVTPFPSAGQTQ